MSLITKKGDGSGLKRNTSKMNRIKRFNESAGQGWEEIEYGELSRRINDIINDDFTDGEVSKVVGVVELWAEDDNRLRRINKWYVTELRIDYGVLRRYNLTSGEVTEEGHESDEVTDANVLQITKPGLLINLVKSVDDWFYVRVLYGKQTTPRFLSIGYRRDELGFVCDQFDSLIKLLDFIRLKYG
jgi:hypothetical protein